MSEAPQSAPRRPPNPVHVCASSVEIGDWQLVVQPSFLSSVVDPLTLKIIFSQAKFVYEWVESENYPYSNSFEKRKVEIPFENVAMMHYSTEGQHSGELRLILTSPPHFYIGKGTIRRNTRWNKGKVADITQMRASVYAVHKICVPFSLLKTENALEQLVRWSPQMAGKMNPSAFEVPNVSAFPGKDPASLPKLDRKLQTTNRAIVEQRVVQEVYVDLGGSGDLSALSSVSVGALGGNETDTEKRERLTGANGFRIPEPTVVQINGTRSKESEAGARKRKSSISNAEAPRVTQKPRSATSPREDGAPTPSPVSKDGYASVPTRGERVANGINDWLDSFGTLRWGRQGRAAPAHSFTHHLVAKPA